MDVETAVQSGKKTIRNIKWNLFFAFWGPKINPMIAGGAMAFSSISVLLNALRLKRFKPSI